MDENDKAGEKGYDNQIDMKEDKKAVDDTISRKVSAWSEKIDKFIDCPCLKKRGH
jgi:hypothetical protein